MANIGLAALQSRVSTRWLVSDVREDQHGRDLNGDADFRDRVIHIVDLDNQVTTNLQLQVGGVCLTEPWVVFSVWEYGQGGEDLNGDGDADDGVIHIHDLDRGKTTSLQLARSGPIPFVSGHWIFFGVPESGQGDQDLNGDGDAQDVVIHVHDLLSATTSNVGIAADGRPYAVSGKWGVFCVREAAQGDQDLNQDGDTDDNVLHAHNMETGTTRNLQLAVSRFHLSGRWIGFKVAEAEQAGRDLNGDGDADDLVQHAHDLESGMTVNLQLAQPSIMIPSPGYVNGHWLTFVVGEGEQGGRDLNGDGDARDTLRYVHDLETGSTRLLDLPAGASDVLSNYFPNRIGFVVSESGPGGARDLNGDGDTDDDVAHAYDLQSGTTTNLGLAVARRREFNFLAQWFPVANGALVAVPESSQGRRDLNGDGDPWDTVLYLHDFETGVTTNLEVAGFAFARLDTGHLVPAVAGNWLVFNVWEDMHGRRDLNGDRDALDQVLHLRDLQTGRTVNLELAGFPVGGTNRWIGLHVDELAQGYEDLNGDGDAWDLYIVHAVDTAALPHLPAFLRGDCNGDGRVTGAVSDALAVLEYNFTGEREPACLAACDANGDGQVAGDVSDAVYLLQYVFLDGQPPPAPFPECLVPTALSDLRRDAAVGCGSAPDGCP